MELPEIFSATLGLTSPWRVTNVFFSNDRTQLDISVGYDRAVNCICPRTDKPCISMGTEISTWCHNDFFHYETYLTARIPGTSCGDPATRIIPPWSQHGSRFVLLDDIAPVSATPCPHAPAGDVLALLL